MASPHWGSFLLGATALLVASVIAAVCTAAVARRRRVKARASTTSPRVPFSDAVPSQEEGDVWVVVSVARRERRRPPGPRGRFSQLDPRRN